MQSGRTPSFALTIVMLFATSALAGHTPGIPEGPIELRFTPRAAPIAPAAPEAPAYAPSHRLLQTPTPEQSPSVEQPYEPFSKGAKYWSLTAASSHDPELGRIYLTQLSVDHYVLDDLAIRTGLTLGYADADRTDGGVQGGPELGVRWHFLTHEHFSIYIDGSAAAVLHEHPLTPESLRFNFDLQTGFGATLHVADETMLQGGVRWHHLSNARIRGKSRNLGYDGPMVYVGVMWAF